MPRIAYVVHDLNDAAVARRVRMMRAVSADIVLLGFYRGAPPPDTIEGARVVVLAKTADSRLVQRALAVVRNLLRAGPMERAAKGADIVIGRNLEALALAARIRRTMPTARLVYECLDIHGLLLGRSLPARIIQACEAALLRRIDLLVLSSPAFLRNHFAERLPSGTPALLVENKLLLLDGAAPHPVSPPPGPPWSIGWFGMLRCARTFEILAELVRRHRGAIQVHIAGRPSPAIFPDFERRVAEIPGFVWHGRYTMADLPRLYGACHFTWAIDYFEEGLNSRWLLPNRLYEAASFGSVPIALRAVETGQWLDRHGAGVTLDDGAAALETFFDTLDPQTYAELREGIAAIPRTDLIATRDDCEAMMAALTGTAH